MTAELEIVAPDRNRHAEEIIDLCAKVFSSQGYYDMAACCRESYLLNSHYDWQASRIGMMDGRIVTHWGVWDYQMRLGQGFLRVGGIGLVATHGQYRKRGLMAQTIPPALEAMAQAGYDMSLLFGIPDFYHRFGYLRAWSDTHYLLSLGQLPSEPPAFGVEASPARHTDEMGRLYNRYAAGFAGTAVRPTYPVRGNLIGNWQIHSWRTPAGKLAGYVVTQSPERGTQHRMLVAEAVGRPQDVLAVAAAAARKAGLTEVKFVTLNHEGDLARTLRDGNCRAETFYHRNAGALARIMNLHSTCAKLLPGLSARLADSTMAGWEGHLAVRYGDQAVGLDIARGDISIAKASRPGRGAHVLDAGDRLIQLLMGTDQPDEVLCNPAVRCRGDAAALARILFPARHPLLSRWDGF